MMNKGHRPTLLAEVKKISPKKIIVTCEDGTDATLPYWELAWTEEERKAMLSKLREGDLIDVIAKPEMAINSYGRIVSKKRVSYDFWNSEIIFDRNKALMIQVDAVTPTRAHGMVYWDTHISGEQKTIELKGYFYFNDLDTYIKANFTEKRWRKHSHIVVGDCLMGIVKHIDEYGEEIELNISDYLRKIKANPQSIFSFQEEPDHWEAQEVAEIAHMVVHHEFLPVAEDISRIAVIDDDPDFLREIVRTLRTLGYLTQGFTSSAEFLSKCNLPELYFDVAFIDANLRGDDDHEGISLAQEIYQENQYIKIVIISGQHSFDQRMVDRGPELSIYDYLRKPLFYEEIQDCLRSISASQPFPLADLLRPSSPPPSRPAINQTETKTPEGTEQARVVLKQLCDYCRGSSAVIFTMHTNTLDCKVKLMEGPMKPADRFLGMLKFSPVKDCIVEGEQISVSEAQAPGSPQQKKHKWLLRYWGDYPAYQSCLGIKLNYQRQGSEYALFWFHPQKDNFNKESLRFAQMTARLLDATNALRGLREELEKERKLSLGGKAMQMTGHELATPLSTIALYINNYLYELQMLKETAAQSPLPEFPQEVLVNLRKAAGIANEMKFYLKGEKLKEFCFKKAIRKSYRSLEELYPGIKIITDPWPEQEYILMANQSTLEYAVFNILLNAAQMMEFFHRPQGVIWLSLQEEPPGWAKLLVTDTGPGIHPKDFERIFQEGFTTKTKGAGLGLAISRRLIEDMGGYLKISYSLLFVSSCFEIKIPLVRVQ